MSRLVTTFVVLLSLSACATAPVNLSEPRASSLDCHGSFRTCEINAMRPTRWDRTLDVSSGSVIIMTMALANKNSRLPWQRELDPMTLSVEKGKEQFIFKFQRDGALDEHQDSDAKDPGVRNYLIRVTLPPGNYVLRGIDGRVRDDTHTSFYLPLHYEVELRQSRVAYLGHVDASIREKRSDSEVRAGPVLPLVNYLVGFSDGTWDVTIANNYDSDLTEFRLMYPSLADARVETDLLPPWDKQKAFAWAQSH